MTTRGWEIYILWKYGSTDWIAIKDLKQSYPIELVDFDQLHGINEEVSFEWCIPYEKQKRKAIISKLKSKY